MDDLEQTIKAQQHGSQVLLKEMDLTAEDVHDYILDCRQQIIDAMPEDQVDRCNAAVGMAAYLAEISRDIDSPELHVLRKACLVFLQLNSPYFCVAAAARDSGSTNVRDDLAILAIITNVNPSLVNR